MTMIATHEACTPTARPTRYSFWKSFITFAALYRQRKDLAELDPYLLADIGLTPEQARKEATRKVWDVPQNWTN